MKLELSLYEEQRETWPESGRHILAQYDDESVVVYQAYKPSIGKFAARHGWFGGDFRYTRMSWIKPNFLWMMYRSNWGTSPGQEIVLAIRLKRNFFDSLLAVAVPSSFHPAVFPTEKEWQAAVQRSEVRLQWDPDHGPTGAKQQRRAIQLGLRRETLRQYGREAILEIGDISHIVADGRERVESGRIAELRMPTEKVYQPADATTGAHIGLAEA